MLGRFTGKIALVTGAAQGIGRAAALRLAREGAAVVAADVQAERAKDLVDEMKSERVSAISVSIDLRNEDCGRRLVETAMDEFGRIDCGVFCAGVTEMKSWTELSSQEWDRMLQINLRGTFLCLQAVAKQLVAQGEGGAIVNLTSTSGHGPRPDAAHYGASKAGLIHLTRTAALALGWHKIRVNAISPGIVKTAMWEQVVRDRAALQGTSPEAYERSAYADVPLARAAEPEEIAALASFLLSDEASYITGQVIIQDGGYSLRVA